MRIKVKNEWGKNTIKIIPVNCPYGYEVCEILHRAEFGSFNSQMDCCKKLLELKYEDWLDDGIYEVECDVPNTVAFISEDE
jgi:hypothetical protein